MKNHIEKSMMVPFVSFILIFIIFSIFSEGKMVSSYNLLAILDQTILIIIAGTGMIFVVAQGGVDLSVGVSLALSGVISAAIANMTGLHFLIIPISIFVGLVVGIIAGFIVSVFKVPSFMTTLAILIGVRGIVNYIQTHVGLHYFPMEMLALNNYPVKLPILIAIVLIMIYVFEYTKIGRYSKAIGENETTAKYIGIPIKKMKIVAFGLSGFMSGIAAIFSMAKLGGTSTTMGVFFEIQVVMAIFLGGVLVTGGTTAKMYKLLIGAFTITIIDNGLALCGLASSEISEAVKGVLLMVVLFFTIYYSDGRSEKTRKIVKYDKPVI